MNSPHDLFSDTVTPRPSRSTLRRALTVFSVTLHAIVIAAIVVVQVFAVGPLPFPRRPLIFDEIRDIHFVQIQGPASPRRSAGSRSESEVVSQNIAPTIPPTGVTPETGRENVIPGVGTIGPAHAVESGLGAVDSIGPVVTVAPPVPSLPPIRWHSRIEAPKKIADVTPAYPHLARSTGIGGVVVLEAVIDAEGNVTGVQVIRSVPLLDQAAIDAVRQWRYSPALLNGKAVPVIVTITVRFALNR
jgi:periplasmic protein TonB